MCEKRRAYISDAHISSLISVTWWVRAAVYVYHTVPCHLLSPIWSDKFNSPVEESPQKEMKTPRCGSGGSGLCTGGSCRGEVAILECLVLTWGCLVSRLALAWGGRMMLIVAWNKHTIGTTGVAVLVGRQVLVPAPHLFFASLLEIYLEKNLLCINGGVGGNW